MSYLRAVVDAMLDIEAQAEIIRRIPGDVAVGDTRLPGRFWDKVAVGDSCCWLWTGFQYGKGDYGGYSAEGRNHRAHRYSYENLVGPIPDGMHIDHLCRVTRCVNPAHLEPVSPGENTLRGLATLNRKMRPHPRQLPAECVHGHRYTESNTYWTAKGSVQCRECARQYQRRVRREGGTGPRYDGNPGPAAWDFGRDKSKNPKNLQGRPVIAGD